MDGRDQTPEGFLSACVDRDVVRLTLLDGTRFEGSYLTQAGMHFLHVRDGSLTGKVHGPFLPEDVASCVLLKSRDEVGAEIVERRMGEPVPGRLTETRDGYEAHLERLANAAARAETFRRRMEIEAQFDEIAERISLAKTKRKWMLAVARWRLHSNEEPDKLEMAGGDLTQAAKLVMPRPQDFDPEPAVRRRREALPADVAGDPLSPPNMLKALRSAGFNARVSVLSDMRSETVDLLVDFPDGKKSGRFGARGKRHDGSVHWHSWWEGGDSATAFARQRRCRNSDEYRTFLGILANGLTTAKAVEDTDGPQADAGVLAPKFG